MSQRIGPHHARNVANRKKKVKYPTLRIITPHPRDVAKAKAAREKARAEAERILVQNEMRAENLARGNE